MGVDNNNTPEATEKGDEQYLDSSSDEGARRFNEALEEGGAYALATGRYSEDFEPRLDEEECECLDPDLDDESEETLPPGEIELIIQNCFII